MADDGFYYFIKGPSLPVVVAEAVGYELARIVGIPVPENAFTRLPGSHDVYFCSRAIKLRSAMDAVLERGVVVNPEILPQTVAFDLWTANTDRNVGNFIGEILESSSAAGGRARLVVIDFESAKVLRGESRFTIGMLPSKKFWPTGPLSEMAKLYPIPTDMCSRIAAVDPHAIEGVFERVSWELDGAEIEWRASAIDQLVKRANKVLQYAQEAWK